jgi:hypothetical protein
MRALLRWVHGCREIWASTYTRGVGEADRDTCEQAVRYGSDYWEQGSFASSRLVLDHRAVNRSSFEKRETCSKGDC